jgi:hypothetical protein
VEIRAGWRVGIKVVKLIFVPTLAAQEWGTRLVVVWRRCIPPLLRKDGAPGFVVEHAKNNFGFRLRPLKLSVD